MKNVSRLIRNTFQSLHVSWVFFLFLKKEPWTLFYFYWRKEKIVECHSVSTKCFFSHEVLSGVCDLENIFLKSDFIPTYFFNHSTLFICFLSFIEKIIIDINELPRYTHGKINKEMKNTWNILKATVMEIFRNKIKISKRRNMRGVFLIPLKLFSILFHKNNNKKHIERETHPAKEMRCKKWTSIKS